MRPERRIVAIESRAITADRLSVVAHVDEDVRMIERRQRADAHELLGADLDCADARLVMKMGNGVWMWLSSSTLQKQSISMR